MEEVFREFAKDGAWAVAAGVMLWMGWKIANRYVDSTADTLKSLDVTTKSLDKTTTKITEVVEGATEKQGEVIEKITMAIDHSTEQQRQVQQQLNQLHIDLARRTADDRP